MATFTAANVNKIPITSSQAGEVIADMGQIEVPDTLALGDIVKLNHLPAEHEIVDFMLQSDDLDEAAALVMSVGVVNADGDDLVANTNLVSLSTVGQAGGVARAAVALGLQLAASNTDRVIGVKVTTAAGTPAAGTLKGVLLYRNERS